MHVVKALVGCWLIALLGLANATAATPQEVTLEVAPLALGNHTITEFRANFLGESPAMRAKRAQATIQSALADTPELETSIRAVPQGYMVMLNEYRAFFITPDDVDPLRYDNAAQTAQAAADNLKQLIKDNYESHNLQAILKAVGLSLLASLVFIALLSLIYWIRRKLVNTLHGLIPSHAAVLKVGETQVIEAHYLYPLISRSAALLRWMLILLLGNEWLIFVLSRFPYTRPWGEQLNDYLINLLTELLHGMASAVPGLGIALVIFFIARGFSAFIQRVLARLATPGNVTSWLNNETLKPTTRLTAIAIWLFAVAMAYPYLPGSDTEAFKGLSVLIGLMVSLGASSVVGQAASGLILTYTRTLRPGEYVRVGEHEGTVIEMGMFTTRIRTGVGEVLTIPNSMITGSVTQNFSREVNGPGYVLDTTITIGYDTPWRQVEAMLIEAAQRTPGILSDPAPRVLHTALADYYPEYRLVAQAIPSKPRPRAELLSMLHANIQDVFNHYGVQIMSPHYNSDPQEAKWVPQDDWFTAPACAPQSNPVADQKTES